MKHIEANSGTRIQLVGKGSNTTAPGEEEGPLCIRITAKCAVLIASTPEPHTTWL